MDEFIEDIARADGFNEALTLAKLNTEGQLFLAGEAVVVPITRAIYDHPSNSATRYHFFTDKIRERNIMPPCWRREPFEAAVRIPPEANSPPSYFKDVMTSRYCSHERGIHVTITELCSVHTINSMGLEPTIANYIKTAPLTTDALVLDIKNEKLWGDQGKKAILEKHVRANNLSHLIYQAFLARIDARKYIEAHANRLGFTHSFQH